MMPKTTCVSCSVGYERVESGVLLVEMFGNPQQPYKIWHADLWRCPGCQHHITSGYGDYPIAEHFQPGFHDELKAHRGTIIRQYEKWWLPLD